MNPWSYVYDIGGNAAIHKQSMKWHFVPGCKRVGR